MFLLFNVDNNMPSSIIRKLSPKRKVTFAIDDWTDPNSIDYLSLSTSDMETSDETWTIVSQEQTRNGGHYANEIVFGEFLSDDTEDTISEIEDLLVEEQCPTEWRVIWSRETNKEKKNKNTLVKIKTQIRA